MQKTRRFHFRAGQIAILGLLLLLQVVPALGADGEVRVGVAHGSTQARKNREAPASKTKSSRATNQTNTTHPKPAVVPAASSEVVELLKKNLAHQEEILAAQQEQIAQL